MCVTTPRIASYFAASIRQTHTSNTRQAVINSVFVRNKTALIGKQRPNYGKDYVQQQKQ
jgi:hypothetical protein